VQAGLFITCLTDTFYPRVGAAMVAVLRHFGCEVRFPSQQTCCGQPAYNNGLPTDAAPLVEKLARIFQHDRYVVSPSASCNAMIKLHGAELFDPGSESRRLVDILADKLHDFTGFLTDVLDVDLTRCAPALPAQRVTWHYSCHCRGIIPFETAFERIRRLIGSRFVPLPRADQCCGFGGAFAAEFEQISDAMLEDKLSCLRQTGADLLICDEAGCRMNIEGGLHRRKHPLTVVHTAELIAEALGLPLPEIP